MTDSNFDYPAIQISSPEAVAQLGRARMLLKAIGTTEPDKNYEQGIADALLWIVGLQDKPLTDEKLKP